MFGKRTASGHISQGHLLGLLGDLNQSTCRRSRPIRAALAVRAFAVAATSSTSAPNTPPCSSQRRHFQGSVADQGEARLMGVGTARCECSTPRDTADVQGISDPSVLPSDPVRLRSRFGLQLLGDRREVVTDSTGREEHRPCDLADGPVLLCDRQHLRFPRGQR